MHNVAHLRYGFGAEGTVHSYYTPADFTQDKDHFKDKDRGADL